MAENETTGKKIFPGKEIRPPFSLQFLCLHRPKNIIS
jgi:hypothetical protein